MPNTAPQCYRCARLHPLRPGAGWRCDAFRTIPKEIMVNAADHRVPYPGDGGVRFEPRVDDMTTQHMATDPPVSASQRRLMWAAAAGHVQGVPQSVGKE